MDKTAALGLHKISLQATMDHLCILAIILPLLSVAKTFYCNDSKITEFEMIDAKNSSTAYVVTSKLIT